MPETATDLSIREAFCCALANGPLLPADAIVVFSGDGKKRLDVATGLLQQRAAHYVVVSGGVDDPPHSLTAPASAKYLISKGLKPSRIIEDNESQNTHEQAEWLAETIEAGTLDKGFGRVLLAVSPYHMYRAFLTVLASLRKRELDMQCHVLPVAASQTSWWACPDGLDVTRMDLLDDEFRKIEEYRDRGHVASWAEGLGYLKFWEGDHDAR